MAFEDKAMRMSAIRLTLSFGLALALGCATAPPPRQLLDARAAYNEARLGKASELTPAELHTAKLALNDAERANEDDPESIETFALAYVALRAAQRVQVLAETKASKAELDRAQQEIDQLETEEMARTKAELARAKKELAVRNEQLNAAGHQIESERAARVAAEEREREAMRKLAEAAALSVKEESRGTVIVLPGSVLFASGKYDLMPEAREKLGMVAETLTPQAKDHDITIEGHTDSMGNPETNQLLSENRARVVMDYMISRGLPPISITSVGIGQARPVSDNSTAEGRANNRRVEIIIKKRR
jgi:outer membrane protein OmpA-like peptidoglycan-associated protein